MMSVYPLSVPCVKEILQLPTSSIIRISAGSTTRSNKLENINGGKNRMHEKESKEKKKKLGDQLDWWEKIGRWR